MSYTLMVILSYSILPAVIAGIIKFKTIEAKYHPIIICFLLALINELVSTILVLNGFSNALNNNVYYLAEAALIVWQFFRWNIFTEHRGLYRVLVILILAGWLVENHSFTEINRYQPFFRGASAILAVIMSILFINRLIVYYNGMLLKCPEFLICIGFCLYFNSVLIVETFLYFGVSKSVYFEDALFKAGSIVNVVSNLLYLSAILWMPKKPAYIRL